MFQTKKLTKTLGLAAFALVACMFSLDLLAIPVPTAPYDSMGGQAYDIIFNKGYDSGMGFVIAGALGLWGFMQLKANWKESVGYGAGATGVAILPTIVTTLGFMY